jgi:twinkle protein
VSQSVQKSPSWITAFRKPGRYVCPVCDNDRRPEHRGEKHLSVKIDEKGIVAYCHHCGTKGVHTWGLDERREESDRSSSSSVSFFPGDHGIVEPALTTSDRLSEFSPLCDRAITYLAGRKISKATADRYGCVSGERFFRRRKGVDAGTAPAIGCRYHSEDQKHYATKWLCITSKNFIADGAAHTLFGPKRDDDKLSTLILTEGEIDAMSVFEATGMVAHSIPNGANDTENMGSKLNFLERCYDTIKQSSKVIIFFDNDEPGDLTGAEVARRIGRAKCWKVHLPKGRKDANDVLVQDGPDVLRALVDGAKPWPIDGLITANDAAASVLDLHRNGLPPGRKTGIRCLDQYLTIQTGMIHILTGKPGGGKSTFLDNLMVNLSREYGWHWAVASFESPTHLALARLIAIKAGIPFRDMPRSDVEAAIEWANRHFSFVTSDGLVTTSSLLDRFDASVTRYGTRGVVVDPFNYIRDPDTDMDTEGVNRFLSRTKSFANHADVAAFVVAHPAKPQFNADADWIPTGYAIAGSAHFYNRADFGITVSRTSGVDEFEGDAVVSVWKSKWQHLGKEGRVTLHFDATTERFMDKRTELHFPSTDGDFI